MVMTSLLVEEWFLQNGLQIHQLEMSRSSVALLALFLIKHPAPANKCSGTIEASLQSDVVTALSKALLPETYASKSQCNVVIEAMTEILVQAQVQAQVQVQAQALVQVQVQVQVQALVPAQVVQETMGSERGENDPLISHLIIRTPMNLQNIFLPLLTLHLIHC